MSACVCDRCPVRRLDQEPDHLLVDRLVVLYQAWQRAWNEFLTNSKNVSTRQPFALYSCNDVLSPLLRELERIVCFHSTVLLLYIVPSAESNDKSRAFSSGMWTDERTSFSYKLTRQSRAAFGIRDIVEHVGGDFSAAVSLLPTIAPVSEPWLSNYLASRKDAYRNTLHTFLLPLIPISDLAHLVNSYIVC
jgi:hypothetical protein